ncbi:hypothetical protein Y900_015705 [Mycolicibacterium aromaticivorans JS19b1 = JCM 16368]|uniref:Uncharacterized protein n=1 Tax=Mycolicibacterium aromaticivorans JS19b1 = JCM 16368 TaxID=1440774 RepID=A0A064CNI4_9MYCO|nr:hypothetical protein Y900_015705 [Mycolicibacterium aromaticivorans JS19b1 = JCM 16368]
MQLDVVAELTSQRHLVGEDRDLVSACVLGVEHCLVGAAQQVRRGIPTRNAQCDTGTDGAGERLTADRHPVAQCIL